MPYFRISAHSSAGQQCTTVVHAPDLATARIAGMKQLGLIDAPRIDVGECTPAEFLAEESRRRGIPQHEITLPE